MRCPYCENPDTKVIDSRPTEEGHAIRRRRGCESLSLIHIQMCIRDSIIGMTLNTFAAGLTVFILRNVYGQVGTWVSESIKGLPVVEIPLIKEIPFIGPILSGHSIFVYLSWLLVFAVWIFLYRTPYGFWMRAAGEHPEAVSYTHLLPQSAIKSKKTTFFGGFLLIWWGYAAQ